MIYIKVYWFLERLSKVGDSNRAIGVFTGCNFEVLDLGLEIVIL